MILRHYDDEALVTMLASGAETSDAHLVACGECAEKLDTFRCVTDALRDAATWDRQQASDGPNANTIATLRAFADSMSAEDAAAEAFLAVLLAGSRETWMGNLAAHPEYRTAGTVRRLLAATDQALNTMPADAVEITALAVEIAEKLAAYRPATLATLRGQAWRERAYALFYTGDVSRAEAAIRMSARHLSECNTADYELARLAIVRALVCRSMEQYPQSVEAARSAAGTFAFFADSKRSVAAQLAEVHSRYGSGDFSEAFVTLLRLEREVSLSDDAETHARVLGNLGFCASKLRRIDEALAFHEAAAMLLDTLGIHTESLRTRWNVASILAEAGRVDEAMSRFERVHAEFKRLGMMSVATLVRLDMAELMLARGNYGDVEEICHTAMSEFKETGWQHTERALTALAFMREAAANRTATPVYVRHVREYLRRLPEEPHLQFLTVPPA